MNITSKSIYGDLDGLARSIKMQMQIYSVQRPPSHTAAPAPPAAPALPPGPASGP